MRNSLIFASYNFIKAVLYINDQLALLVQRNL